jgi:hypothetical protein
VSIRKFFKRLISHLYCGDGFEVELMSLWKLVYREGAKQLELYTEPLIVGRSTQNGVHIPARLQWLPPYEKETITEEKARQIEARIVHAMTQLGEPFQIIRR